MVRIIKNQMLVWFFNGAGLDVKMSSFQMFGIQTLTVQDRTAQPFEYRIYGHDLVFSCTGLVFEWSC